MTHEPAPKRIPLLSLLTASAISQSGSALTLVAVPWFVLQTTGSAAKTGLTGVFAALPFIVAGVFGGALVDRLGFTRASVLSDLMSGVTVALVPLLYSTVGLAFWQLLTLTFLSNLLATPGNTARQSMVPELAMMARLPLERANAFVQAVPRVATLLGPPLAGVLIVVMGASNVLWLDAATFGASAALVGALVPARAAARPVAAGGRYLAGLAEGFRFLWRDRLLRAMSVVFAIGNFLDAPISLLFVVYATQRYDSAVAAGLFFAALGAGAIIGSLWYGMVGHRRLARRAVLACYSVPVAVMYAAFAFALPFPVLLAVLFLDGLAVGPVNPLSATVMQERVPVALRGRVYGLRLAISFVTIPLGRGIAGLLVEPVGLPAIFLAIAAASLLIALSVALAPAFRAMQPPESPSACRETARAHAPWSEAPNAENAADAAGAKEARTARKGTVSTLPR